ncbi:hypothetical protein SAMN05216389_11649 [Oceanobacillus limi]|uniref:Uncharacterized protein n=1 Tax=Oceanobacillus limi TaxID=930131 RepID=A0A1I0FMV4_9BACI|nr:hypothetical protein [Oceanobacillus limi]SET59707.1 hypothetical protein SAMN05216389_11649 [Oceanobacillus limi]
MGVFQKLFGSKKVEKKPLDYKKQLLSIMGEEDLNEEMWFRDLVMQTIDQLELDFTPEQVASRLKEWTETGRIPNRFAKEEFLNDIYQNHAEWVQEMSEIYFDVYQDRKTNQNMESFLNDQGDPYRSMSSFRVKQTYFALHSNFLNVISQII